MKRIGFWLASGLNRLLIQCFIEDRIFEERSRLKSRDLQTKSATALASESWF